MAIHNVELASIVDVGDAHDVTPLLPSVDNPLALADDKHIRQLTLMVVRPLRPNSLARVEELGLGGAEGTDASGESMSDHCEFVASPIFRYGTYKFLL